MGDAINLVVCGVYYSLRTKDIERFPDSYFAHILKDVWNTDRSAPVQFNRDGDLFRYVQHYLFTGELDPKSEPSSDLQFVLSLKVKADFYNLPGLVKLCDDRSHNIIQTWCTTALQSRPSSFLLKCEADSHKLSADPLVRLLAPFRLPSIAATRLQRYQYDRSNFWPQEELLNDIRKQRTPQLDSNMFHGCKMVNGVTDRDTLFQIWLPLQKWPFCSNMYLQFDGDDDSIAQYAYTVGAHCTGRVLPTTGDAVGVFLYIFSTTFTGGAVTATVNGVSVSISQPGECLAIAPGVSYSVETVTSGVLILLEFVAVPGGEGDIWCSLPDWTFHPVKNETNSGGHISLSVKRTILNCIDELLFSHTGVIVCLCQHYPIVHSVDDDQKPFTTDPDTLMDVDAELYALFAAKYSVRLVSMYTAGSGEGTWKLDACILDDIYSSCPHDNSILDNNEDDVKYKVVAPTFGCAEPFSFWTAGKTIWGTLLTGIIITK